MREPKDPADRVVGVGCALAFAAVVLAAAAGLAWRVFLWTSGVSP